MIYSSGTGTGMATTEDWLEVTKDMTLTAYDPQCISPGQNNAAFIETNLDMRTGRRSLREKARGKMSEFDRQYPW